VNLLLLRLFAVEAEQHHLFVDRRLKVDRSPPEFLNALERFDAELDFQINARVLMSQIQLAAIGVVAVHHINVWLHGWQKRR